jgi:hypothetical protein
VLIGTFIPFDVTFHLGGISKSAKGIHIPSDLKPMSLGFIIGLWIFLLLTTKSGISIRKRLPKELLKYGSINNRQM